MPLSFRNALAAVMAAIPLAGCAGGKGFLREAGLEGNPARKELAAPEFVTASRRSQDDFLPVGVSAPQRAVRARNEASRKALEAELEAAGRRNQARGKAAEGVAKGVGKGLAGSGSAQPAE